MFNSDKKCKEKRNNTAFRAAYGELAILRSFLKEGELLLYLFSLRSSSGEINPYFYCRDIRYVRLVYLTKCFRYTVILLLFVIIYSFIVICYFTLQDLVDNSVFH